MKQRHRYNIGKAVEIMAYTFAWFGAVNTAMIGLLSYDRVKEILVKYVTILNWDWFTLPMFFLCIFLAIAVVYGTELLIIYPARQKFRNNQEVDSGSPIMEEIKKRPTKEEIKQMLQETLKGGDSKE